MVRASGSGHCPRPTGCSCGIESGRRWAMDERTARNLVARLVAAYRPRDWGRTNEQVYVESLLDLDGEEAERAVDWIMSHDSFFPTIARLRSEIADDYKA